MSIIEMKDLSYSYDNKKNIFKNLNMSFETGKIYAILGHSGCGKSTLLSLLGGLDKPTKGKVMFNNEDISQIGLDIHRRKHVSFIFQNYNLIDYMNAVENVKLTARIPAKEILEELGIKIEEQKRNVLKLSGGQQQRVAIARSLASDSSIILADEPTGNLDDEMAKDIADILLNAAHNKNKCIIVVTHSRELARKADTIYRLSKGKIKKDK